MVLEMFRLLRDANGLRAKCRDAAPLGTSDALIMNPVSSNSAQRDCERSACDIRIRIQQGPALGVGKALKVVKFGVNAADENPHIFIPTAIA